MHDWNPTPQYTKVAEANRQYYTRTAQTYDTTETCLTDQHAQQMLDQDLDRIILLFKQPPATLHALDACGGSGNVALKLLHRGVDTTICDISPELLEIFQAKCVKQALTPTIICSEIGAFLVQQKEAYDIIVFSSALHHLENIENVLFLAYESLKSGGLLFTVFDPTPRHDRITRTIMWLDYIIFKIHRQSTDLVAATTRRLRRTYAALTRGRGNGKQYLDLNEATLGVLAEYHVEQGIDDVALVERLKQIGFELVWHERYQGARYGFMRLLLWLRKDVTAFKLLLRKKPT